MLAFLVALSLTNVAGVGFDPLPAILPRNSAVVETTDDPFVADIRLSDSCVSVNDCTGNPVQLPNPIFKNGFGDWVNLTGKVSTRDPLAAKDDPVRRDTAWTGGETVKLPVVNNLAFFGAMDVGSESVEQQQLRWAGKTGVELKVHPWLVQEVQFRGGQALKYDNQDLPPRGFPQERTEMFVDVSAKLPVPIINRPLNLAYSGTSIPAITGYDRPKMNQDVKLAVPLPDGLSTVSVGARMTREETATSIQTPWITGKEVYLGVELKH